MAKNQPAKLAAFEELYPTTSNAPLVLAGWVDEKNEIVVGFAAPGMLSFLTHNDFHTPVTGLNEFKPEDRPPITVWFLFFHGIVGIGFILIAVAALGFLYFRKGTRMNAAGCCGYWFSPCSARSSPINSAGLPPKSGGNRGLFTA